MFELRSYVHFKRNLTRWNSSYFFINSIIHQKICLCYNQESYSIQGLSLFNIKLLVTGWPLNELFSVANHIPQMSQDLKNFQRIIAVSFFFAPSSFSSRSSNSFQNPPSPSPAPPQDLPFPENKGRRGGSRSLRFQGSRWKASPLRHLIT